MSGGVYGWAENKDTVGPHRMVPVTYDQYIAALEEALIELSFIWPTGGTYLGDRPDNSWLNRVRKNLRLELIGGLDVKDITDFSDGSGDVRRGGGEE